MESTRTDQAAGAATAPDGRRVSVFADDALGRHDAVGLADALRRREISPDEVLAATRDRLAAAADLNAVVGSVFETPVAGSPAGPFGGVPTLLKDNSDLAGVPTGVGSEIVREVPVSSHGPVARELLRMGLTIIAKSTLPEFGLSASTEFPTRPPTRNPWHTGYSSGASSGGSAALVAAGAVTLAYANDGGGSIRIPAACCGLVGLKPSRGRFVLPTVEKMLPVPIVADGVVTRTVRDTARFWAEADRHSSRSLRPIGSVTGPSARRLRVGLVLSSLAGSGIDDATRQATEDAAAVVESLGHRVEPIDRLPIDAGFPDDFVRYWSFLAFALQRSTPRAPRTTVRDFDPLTVGLADRFRRDAWRLPAVIRRLRRAAADYASMFASVDVVLSPVTGKATPPLGYLSPRVPFDLLLERLTDVAVFTPLHNVVGAPAISLPLGPPSPAPLGAMFSARQGDDRTLLELAFELEQAAPWPTLAGSGTRNGTGFGPTIGVVDRLGRSSPRATVGGLVFGHSTSQ
ncbi:amidase [Rhodococcoides kroppenstedtii]|uniref:amidase n=1 Tax=Rhodococcoides kroppenstedtii TaxID=293050 RepID=UPI001BDE7FE9|nr:amidase [Rhodococcus kroppenstedtii]MBT1193594.1 amidase [Rhodococcus kroppenstedtii]